MDDGDILAIYGKWTCFWNYFFLDFYIRILQISDNNAQLCKVPCTNVSMINRLKRVKSVYLVILLTIAACEKIKRLIISKPFYTN